MPLDFPSDFPGVLRVEVEDIRARRRALFPHQQPLADGPAPATDHPYTEAHRVRALGLAFSGGGIRSATFNLGVLQGLAELGLLPFIDYLSTVSGGGYIGSWLHGVIRNRFLGDPAAAQPELDPSRVPRQDGNDPITFLRKYSNYLAPELGLFSPDFWTIAAVWIRNMSLNLLILIPFLIGVVLTVLMSGLLQQKFGRDLASSLARELWVFALGVAVIVIGVNLRQIVFAQFPDLTPRFKLPDLTGRGIVGGATVCIMFAAYILGAFRFDPQPIAVGILLFVLFALLQWLGGFRLCYRAPVSPGDQAGTRPAIHRQHHRPRGIARVPRGQPLLAIDRRRRRPGGGKGRRIVDLGIDAPFHVLRHRRAFLLLLQLLKLL